jgi:hypothetical protein
VIWRHVISGRFGVVPDVCVALGQLGNGDGDNLLVAASLVCAKIEPLVCSFACASAIILAEFGVSADVIVIGLPKPLNPIKR